MATQNDRYRDLGIKLTPQRIAILDFLDGNLSHPSAEDVYRAVSRRFPTISHATVYNTLETLKARGRVVELTGDPEKKRFDPDPRPHHHLICTACRRIEDLNVEFRLSVPAADLAGYAVTGNHIEFYGTCPACAKKNDRSKKQGGTSNVHGS